MVDTVRGGSTGVLVEPRKPEQLAEAIVRLLTDAPERTRMGQAGREFVRREYEWNQVLDDWLEVCHRALDRVCVMV